jgi:hypothetical protein
VNRFIHYITTPDIDRLAERVLFNTIVIRSALISFSLLNKCRSEDSRKTLWTLGSRTKVAAAT